MATQAQIEANRRNALLSKGPTSPEGKAVSRFNGLKHGLRAEEVVLPGEDPAEFEAQRQAWLDDWQPRSHTRSVLVDRAALAAWRLHRAAKAEADLLRATAEQAGRRFDDERILRVRRAADRFRDDPAAALSLLGCHADGLDYLLGAWRDLARALRDGASGWRRHHHETLLPLLGHPVGTPSLQVGPEALASARLWAVNDPAQRVRPMDQTERRGAVGLLRRLVAAKLRELRARRLAAADPAADRPSAIASAVALAFASKEEQLRHRYEAEHDRMLRSTVRQLLALERQGADLGAAGPPGAAGPGLGTRGPRPGPDPDGRPGEARTAAPTEDHPRGVHEGVPEPSEGVTSPEPAAPSASAPGSVGAGDSDPAPGRPAAPDRPAIAPKPAPKGAPRGVMRQ